MKYKIALCIFLVINSLLFCQNKDTVLITPGNKLLQSGKLKDYNKKYDFISYKDGTETIVGGLEDNFNILTDSKEKLGLRICNIRFGTNTILDSGLCFLKGLKPIYHRSVQTKKKIILDFNNEIVNGSVTSVNDGNNKNEIINYTAPIPLFDSYYEDLIAKTISLKKGLLFKFPEYIYERGGTVWSSGEIAGKEKAQNQKGDSNEVWKVIFYEKNSEGKIIRTTTYLINPTDRQIISREYKTETSRILMKQRQG